tara:strand:- start:21 stop:866 length:846 start_codon:yes stop_codon:yes gene_type:complete
MATPPWLSALNLSTGFPLSDALSALPQFRNGSSSTSAGTALAEATAPGTSSVCQQLSRYIGCPCTDMPELAARVSCSAGSTRASALIGSSMAMLIDFKPCAEPPVIDLELLDESGAASVPLKGMTLFGESRTYLPGLSMKSLAGLVAVVSLQGNVQRANVSVGFDGCVGGFGVQRCGSQLHHALPLWVLRGAPVSFGHSCSGERGRGGASSSSSSSSSSAAATAAAAAAAKLRSQARFALPTAASLLATRATAGSDERRNALLPDPSWPDARGESSSLPRR